MSRKTQTDWYGCLVLLGMAAMLVALVVGGVVKFLAFWKVAFS